MNASVTAHDRNPSDPGIMVVDDAECIRDAIREIFAVEGIEVLTATGARDCLSHLRQGFWGVILMDVMMPEKNGWDTIREIEAAGLLKGNIIVMLTGMDAPDECMEGLQEIVIDYITKPFAPAALIATVQKYVSCLKQSRWLEV